MSFVYCPECGFQNPEAAKYCSKCGALLVRDDPGSETTLSIKPEELEDTGVSLESLGIHGPALVVRAGGGRAGEVFHPTDSETTIGRSPDCHIFLDDVTVSRKHAVISHENGRFLLADQGSLNGTFLNKSRIERAELSDGDEVQIGKYRLTFFG